MYQMQVSKFINRSVHQLTMVLNCHPLEVNNLENFFSMLGFDWKVRIPHKYSPNIDISMQELSQFFVKPIVDQDREIHSRNTKSWDYSFLLFQSLRFFYRSQLGQIEDFFFHISAPHVYTLPMRYSGVEFKNLVSINDPVHQILTN